MNDTLDSSIEYSARKKFPIPDFVLLPIVIFVGMVAAFVLLDAVLPLKYLQFHDALVTQLGRWPIRPTLLLFPGWALAIPVPGLHMPRIRTVNWPLAWGETGLLIGAFLLVFLVYLLGLRSLPRRITQRYIFFSTLLLGLLCVSIPVVTSSDVFSYTAYARLGVIYHQNPLTALPILIRFDPVYSNIYWVKQPSAYGPVWAVITCLLQMLVNALGFKGIVPMVLALRLFGLAMHLGSTMLIWSISGYLMEANGAFFRKRLLLTLAFAWNPLLLLEACVNAHIDTAVLFFILLSLWLLARKRTLSISTILQAAILFAIATCLKINIVLLTPGLLLFLWMQPQRWRNISGATLAYLGTIVLLYLPFWQGGAVLNVYRVNPGINHSINSLAQFVARFFSSVSTLLGHKPSRALNLAIDLRVHTISAGVFIVLFALLCGWAIYRWRWIGTLSGLIRWLALAWLLYCIVGTPWFWPWYSVTFFGLYALVEATTGSEPSPFATLKVNGAVRLMAFSMLSVYCFSTWLTISSYVPGLTAFKWTYFCGIWIWLLPLLAIGVSRRKYRLSKGLVPAPVMVPPEKVRTLV
jgi:hypothetical protein